MSILLYSLTTTYISTGMWTLQGQLCALRRISRNYDECKDSVILMNKRLAQDNSLISANLSSLRRELKSVTQVCILIWSDI